MDRDVYPGDGVMQRLWAETNLAWTGYYLPRLSYKTGKVHAGTWKGKRATLKNMGWGVVPIFFGRQQEHAGATDAKAHRKASLTTGHGAAEGKLAASVAQADGFPAYTVIYLDIEGGNDVTHELADYYAGWCQAVFDNNYYPGVYCSPLKAPALMEKDTRPLTWCAAYRYSHRSFPVEKDFPINDPSGSGYALADAWQLAGDCFVTEVVTDKHGHHHTRKVRDEHGAPLNIDFNTSIAKDPSRFLEP
jgi:hypothetical protein